MRRIWPQITVTEAGHIPTCPSTSSRRAGHIFSRNRSRSSKLQSACRNRRFKKWVWSTNHSASIRSSKRRVKQIGICARLYHGGDKGGRPWQVRGNRKRHPLSLRRLTRVLPSPFAASISISREHAARNSIEVLVTFARTSAVICCLLSAFVFGANIQIFGAPSQDLLASVD